MKQNKDNVRKLKETYVGWNWYKHTIKIIFKRIYKTKIIFKQTKLNIYKTFISVECLHPICIKDGVEESMGLDKLYETTKTFKMKGFARLGHMHNNTWIASLILQVVDSNHQISPPKLQVWIIDLIHNLFTIWFYEDIPHIPLLPKYFESIEDEP